jgi:hypothetical protein
MSTTNSIPHQAASRVIRGIKNGVSGQVEDSKTRAAEGIVGMADAVRRLSDELRGHSEPVAKVVDAAGSRLQTVADQVRDADPAEIAQRVAQFARQRPMLFVGAAFIVGLGVSQLLRAAATGEGAAALREATDTLKDLSGSSVGA